MKTTTLGRRLTVVVVSMVAAMVAYAMTLARDAARYDDRHDAYSAHAQVSYTLWLPSVAVSGNGHAAPRASGTSSATAMPTAAPTARPMPAHCTAFVDGAMGRLAAMCHASTSRTLSGFIERAIGADNAGELEPALTLAESWFLLRAIGAVKDAPAWTTDGTRTPNGAGWTWTDGAWKLSLAQADATALDVLPSIGPKTAAAILEYIAARGAPTVPTRLTAVRGIGTSTAGAIAPAIAW